MTNDEALGMSWWNHLTERERAAALDAANTACVADAWAHFKARTAQPDRLLHLPTRSAGSTPPADGPGAFYHHERHSK